MRCLHVWLRAPCLGLLCLRAHSMNTQASSIRSLFLDGPAGKLEALINTGATHATHAGLVCHPHPLYGGTLHNKVVFHAMKALNNFGFPVLRFNFRGAGLSQGEHDQGNGEAEDVRMALDWLDRRISSAYDSCWLLVWRCGGIARGAVLMRA